MSATGMVLYTERWLALLPFESILENPKMLLSF